jgi:hypothetical protein
MNLESYRLLLDDLSRDLRNLDAAIIKVNQFARLVNRPSRHRRGRLRVHP